MLTAHYVGIQDARDSGGHLRARQVDIAHQVNISVLPRTSLPQATPQDSHQSRRQIRPPRGRLVPRQARSQLWRGLSERSGSVRPPVFCGGLERYLADDQLVVSLLRGARSGAGEGQEVHARAELSYHPVDVPQIVGDGDVIILAAEAVDVVVRLT